MEKEISFDKYFYVSLFHMNQSIEQIFSCCISADGILAAVAYQDNAVGVWNIQSSELINVLRCEKVNLFSGSLSVSLG